MGSGSTRGRQIDQGPDFNREEMILQYYSLVKSVAYRLVSRFPPNVEIDDLINVGCLGLIDAIDRFTPERAASFRSYAEMRIRGAMIDELRSLDWVPRSVRQRMDEADRAQRELTRNLGRSPTDAETAKYLGMGLDQFQSLAKNSALLSVISLEELGINDDNRRDIHQVLKDPTGHHPEALMELKNVQEKLAMAIGQLKERERIVVSLYYKDDLTLREIGEVLGVTESRVSQIHSQSIRRLKLKLKKLMIAQAV